MRWAVSLRSFGGAGWAIALSGATQQLLFILEGQNFLFVELLGLLLVMLNEMEFPMYLPLRRAVCCD